MGNEAKTKYQRDPATARADAKLRPPEKKEPKTKPE